MGFCVRSKTFKGQAFSTWQGRARLTYGKFTAKIKAVAKGEGYDEAHFHTHSFRIGGASALAARGVPDHVIQSVGRWKSLAFLAYIRLSTRAYNSAVDMLCDLKSLTTEDVRRMLPGVKRAQYVSA